MDYQHSTDAEEAPTTEAIRDALDAPPATKLHLIQHHANMALLLAKQLLEEEVEDLAGQRYSRKDSGNSLRRWGKNPGSIRIGGEKVSIDVDADVRSAEVPHLILQPLVENAVRHGIEPLERPGRLRITATRAGWRLRLVVEDDGVGLSEDAAVNGRPGAASDADGLGLAMTRDRLGAAYGPDHSFRVMESDAGGARVVVEVPIEADFENGRGPAPVSSESVVAKR